MRRLLLTILAPLAFAACEPRGDIAFNPAPDQPGMVERLFVGSTRAFEPAEGGFGEGRERDLRHARFDVSIPPDHASGEIEWPRFGKADPARFFVTRQAVLFPRSTDFEADLRADLSRLPAGEREAVIFVHGYNNTFAEGLYRLAQLRYDLALPGIPVAYAWPSMGNPLGYAYDRDSVLFARDGLQTLMRQVRDAGAEQIILVAHSMGSQLTMEVLRQMAIGGDRALLDRLGGVVLISPDIDVDVFRAQVERIGTLPQPFIVFTSQNDKILKLSARLNGDGQRLGDIEDVDPLRGYKITFVDVSAFYAGKGGGHFTVGNSPSLIRLLDKLQKVEGAFVSDRTKRLGLTNSVVMTVEDATRIVLSPLTALAGGTAP